MFCLSATHTTPVPAYSDKRYVPEVSLRPRTPQTLFILSVWILVGMGCILTLSLPELALSEVITWFVFTLAGLAALFAVSHLTLTQLSKYGFWLLCTIFVISAFVPIGRSLTPLFHTAALLFCPLFTIALCSFHGARWYGIAFFPILLLLFESVLILNRLYTDSFIVLILCSGFYLTALWAGWFGIKSITLSTAITASAAFTAVLGLWSSGARLIQRVTLVMDQDIQPLLLGYEGILSRAASDGAKPWGMGSLPFEYLPELASKAPGAAIMYSAGWIPVLCFYLALFAFLVCCGAKAKRLQSRCSRFFALSILLTLLLQALFSVMLSCGFPLVNTSCPFLASGPAQTANLILTGILLALLRQSKYTDASFQNNFDFFFGLSTNSK